MKAATETIAFIRDTFSTKDPIPLHEPVFSDREREYVMDTIDSTFVSSVGEYVDRFEGVLQKRTKTAGAVAVVNGTAGLQIALRLAGVQQGEEVLTQALTFIATANAISYNGASPVFLDVDRDTMGLSPDAVQDFLDSYAVIREGQCFNKSTGKRIAACLPMHTFGFPTRIEELARICTSWHIPLVEDAAESLGSEYRNKPTGSFGKLGVFSFNGNKIVTCGGGGAIVTNDRRLRDKGKHLTTTAKKPHAFEYEHDEIGFNYRMPNLNAALGCAQLEALDDILAKKRILAGQYASFFEKREARFRQEMPGTKANYWLMSIELDSKAARDQFLKLTNEDGVMTRPIWQLMYRSPMYSTCFRDEQVNAEFLEERIVNIPSSVK